MNLSSKTSKSRWFDPLRYEKILCCSAALVCYGLYGHNSRTKKWNILLSGSEKPFFWLSPNEGQILALNTGLFDIAKNRPCDAKKGTVIWQKQLTSKLWHTLAKTSKLFWQFGNTCIAFCQTFCNMYITLEIKKIIAVKK